MKLRHAAIVALRPELLINFYVSMGLSVVSQEVEQGRFVSRLVGLEGAKLFVTKMRFDGGGLLEIIGYEEPCAIDRGRPESNGSGLSHLAITTDSIDETSQRVVANGGFLVGQPMPSPNGRVMACYARDPEGNIIEIVEEIQSA